MRIRARTRLLRTRFGTRPMCQFQTIRAARFVRPRLSAASPYSDRADMTIRRFLPAGNFCCVVTRATTPRLIRPRRSLLFASSLAGGDARREAEINLPHLLVLFQIGSGAFERDAPR